MSIQQGWKVRHIPTGLFVKGGTMPLCTKCREANNKKQRRETINSFIKTKNHSRGISSPFGCVERPGQVALEEGFSACTQCNKRHLTISDCQGKDYVCNECRQTNMEAQDGNRIHT
jgi:hypothetical protein